MRRPLPRAVWLLGLTSLFNDSASEAVYPLLPLFLTRVLGAGVISLGIIEGVAEAANSVLKLASGYVSDRWRTRRPLAIAGYGLACGVRPFIALITTWPQLLLVRFVDRVGKGVRSAPRDAMLASWAGVADRGRIFGFHRAMDHAGAMIGPILASLFLLAFPGRYRLLFALTIIPGVMTVLTLWMVREREVASVRDAPRAPSPSVVAQDFGPAPAPSVVAQGFSRAPVQPSLPRRFHAFIAVLLLFSLGNSTDAFLLLRFSSLGISAAWIPLLWALLHAVKGATSLVGGALSDRVGRRAIIGLGWLVYAVVYFGFAVTTSLGALVAWFLVYGFYYGFSEGTEKALVADLAPASLRGAAFGYYNAALGVGALAASVIFGLVWKAWGAPPAFALGAGIAMLATVLLFLVVPAPARRAV